MKVLALDLSSKPGIAFFKNGELIDTNTFSCKVVGKYSSSTYPFNYIDMAETIAKKIAYIVLSLTPDYIVIEETNKGRNRYSQKQLEFIHCAVGISLRDLIDNDTKLNIRYIDVSAWRKILGISLNKDQRKNNKFVKDTRQAQLNKISQEISDKNFSILKDRLNGIASKRLRNKIIKDFGNDCLVEAKKVMRSFRTKESKVDTKHLSVAFVNNHFNLDLKKKDNDIADAICVGFAFISNNYSSTLKR